MLTGLGSPTHLLILLVIILLLFGTKRLPEMGRSLGRGIQEFKNGLNSKEEPEVKRPEAVEKGEEQANTGMAQKSPQERLHEKNEAVHTKE
jgi:sec-independent protein translocase protein TatA